MDQLSNFISHYFSLLPMPRTVRWEDVVEIIIISVLVYQIMVWIKRTKAWSLLKGLVVIMFFILIAAIFEMSTIFGFVVTS